MFVGIIVQISEEILINLLYPAGKWVGEAFIKALFKIYLKKF